MTIVQNSPVSSASGLVSGGQQLRGEPARRPAEPFVLPADDRAAPKLVTERKEADPSDRAASTSRPERAKTPERKAAPEADERFDEPVAEATPKGAVGPSSLVALQEDASQAIPADGVAEAEATVTAEAAAAAVVEAAEQKQIEVAATAVQQVPIAASIVAAAAGGQLAGDAATLEAAAIATQAKALQEDQVKPQQIATGAAGSGAAPTAESEASREAVADPLLSGGGKDAIAGSQVEEMAKAGVEMGKAVAPTVNPSDMATSTDRLEPAAPAEAEIAGDKKTDQASASSAAAKNELVTRLEQSFAQPLSRPAEIAPQPLPPPSAPMELPKAIPPSAVPMEIGLRSLQGLKEFQIRLDPAELGRIDVKLEIAEDKSVTARVVVDRVETLHLLQREAKTLERAFEQAGLKSSDASVDITLRDPGQQGEQGRRDGWSGDSETGVSDGRGGKPAAVEMPIIPIRRTLHVGALDRSI